MEFLPKTGFRETFFLSPKDQNLIYLSYLLSVFRQLCYLEREKGKDRELLGFDDNN